MNKQTTRGVCFLVICLALAIAAPLSAQQSAPAEKPAIYTYVAEWTVPRAQWARHG